MSNFSKALDFITNKYPDNYGEAAGAIKKIVDILSGNEETKGDIKQRIINRLKDDEGKGILKNEVAKGLAEANVDNIVFSLSKEMKANEIDILSAFDYTGAQNKNLKYNQLNSSAVINSIKNTYQDMMIAKDSGISRYRSKEAIDSIKYITGDNPANAKLLSEQLNDEKYDFNKSDKLSILGSMKSNIRKLKKEGFDSNLAFNSVLSATTKVQDAIANGTITDQNTAENVTAKLVNNYAKAYKGVANNKERAANLQLLTAGSTYNSDFLTSKSDREISQLARQHIGNGYEEKYNLLLKATNLFDELPETLKKKEISKAINEVDEKGISDLHTGNTKLDNALIEQNLGRRPGYLSELNIDARTTGINGSNIINSTGNASDINAQRNNFYNRATSLNENSSSKDITVNIQFNDEVVSTIGKWVARNKGE